MNNYGKSAVRAVDLLHSNEVCFADDAWEMATTEIFTRPTKACPRSAFLGLCESGLVKGLTKDQIKNRLKSSINKDHAIDAINLLTTNQALISYKPIQLWREIMKGDPKSHNFQMDVVLALWKNGLIVPHFIAIAHK